MNPRTACTRCEVDLLPAINGVYVIEYANFGPYKIWYSDELACPNCDLSVLTGFPDTPLAEHYQPRFAGLLGQALASGKVRHNFENQAQREAWIRRATAGQASGAQVEPDLSV